MVWSAEASVDVADGGRYGAEETEAENAENLKNHRSQLRQGYLQRLKRQEEHCTFGMLAWMIAR